MSKNKDKETGSSQPKAEIPAIETQPDNANIPNAGEETQAGAVDHATEHPNPARATSDAAEVAKTDSTPEAATSKTIEKPSVSDALVKIGKSILKSNPTMSMVYMTADGRGFYEKNDADNHARTLKNKVVTHVKK